MTGVGTVDQRYYASAYGRFNTVDPLASSAKPEDPVSWNRYNYLIGDPVNGSDPRGLDGTYCGPDLVWDGEGCTDLGIGMSLSNIPMSGAYNPYGVGPTGQSSNPGSMIGQTSADLLEGYNSYVGGLPVLTASTAGSTSQTPNCQTTILNAVNSQFGTSLDASNVLPSTSLLPQPGGGQVNLNIGVLGGLTPGQFNSIQPGRYAPPGLLGVLIGLGPSLHVVPNPSSLDPVALSFSNANVGGVYIDSFTAHIDSAWADNPIGLVLHGIIDVLGSSTRNPCP
jgi:RHS repeat-associated protein